MMYEVCPKCKSGSFDASSFEQSDEMVYRIIMCENCGFEWQEVFEFSENSTVDTCETLDDEGNVI